MKGAKKAKKNGNDSGGVVAAVTKHAAGKFTSNKDSASEASETSSPLVHSPQLVPASLSNGNYVSSPALDAVSAISYATNTTRSTTDWMRGMPGLGSSPGGNLISLMGESPPTQPSSYEDGRGAPYAWSSTRPHHNCNLSSTSPPSHGRIPLGFHMNSPYPSTDGYDPSAISARRGSMHSQTAYDRGMPNPPPPHQPQPHFYQAPQVGLDFGQESGMTAGERGYAYGFDRIPSLGGTGSGRGKDTVVLTGYEGGLKVHSITKNGLDTVANLCGLRGGVYFAKILPWTLDRPVADPSLLVAVVIHGPVLSSVSPESRVDGNYNGLQGNTGVALPVPLDLGQRGNNSLCTASVDFYQTTVDIYSLQDSRHIAALLEGPKIPLKFPITSPIFQAPEPSGSLQIFAERGNIVVASGQTGESWLYRQASSPHEHGVEFRCVGKLWTCLQQPLTDPNTQDADRSCSVAQRQIAKTPMIALRGRWIAYCPAAPSSQVSLRAAVPVPLQGKAPGLASLTPPQLPSVISDVDLPTSDSIMNKLMRETTQEVISGAKWIGERGLQALSNYWNKSASPNQQQARAPTNAQQWKVPQFPPTHAPGAAASAISKDPGLISIVDVESSLNSTSIHPITTFATSGCSFLSFAPNGLFLFSASTKGDVQTIWNLMRSQYTKSSPLLSASSHGPRVRQVAQFSRMTVARIMDVSWTKPNGECVAMVTKRGTVHLLDVPTNAFMWPPPRRRIWSEEASSNASESNTTAVSIATGALSSAWDAARPLINRSRRSSSIAMANLPQTTGSKIVEHANYGGRAIAAGISHSLGKTGNAISQLRHSRENRISLPSSSNPRGPSCVVLVTNRSDHSLFALGNGFVRIFPQRPHKRSTAEGSQSATRFRRYKDLRLPMLPDDTIAPTVKRLIDPEEDLDLLDNEGDGVNTMVLTVRTKQARRHSNAVSSIPQAEIESSAPYQPFHTDKRVALYETVVNRVALCEIDAFSSATTTPPILPTASVLLTGPHLDYHTGPSLSERKHKIAAAKLGTDNRTGKLWVFGQSVPMTRLNAHHSSSDEGGAYAMSTDDMRALPQFAMERSVVRHRDDGEQEQIVVTTRRRRGGGRNGDADDDGFFEDDCEVLDFADQRV